MAIIQGNAKQGSTRGFYPKVINGSLRFNDDDSAYLSWTPASAGNQKKWTFSTWVKWSAKSADGTIFSAGTGSSAWDTFGIYGTGTLIIYQSYNGASQARAVWAPVIRDPSAWYHLVLQIDFEATTNTDRMKLYINGERITSYSGTLTWPATTWNSYTNGTGEHRLGYRAGSPYGYYDGYLANVHFIDGQALTADDFGSLKNGVWVAEDYAGTFGTNGFYLTFEDDTQVEAFNTVLYRGNGGTQSITGVGFSPDLVWLKRRGSAVASNRLLDTVRGVQKNLYSDLTSPEQTQNSVMSFDSDGFTVGDSAGTNASGDTFVAWCWKAGDSNVSNNVGSIPSTVRANDTYGFSVVSYTGNGTVSQTVGHGLGSAPTNWMVIIKNRSAVADWQVWHSGDSGVRLKLNTTDSDFGNRLISFGTDTITLPDGNSASWDASGNNYIAYCWAEKANYSSFGSYTGDGTTDGSKTVDLGFDPAFVLIKEYDNNTTDGDSNTASGNWLIWDATRDTHDEFNTYLLANSADAENAFPGNTAGPNLQKITDGFAFINNNAGVNGNGRRYIYAAFADTREAAFWLDQSGNDNDWQPVNLDHNDTVADSPTDNFATWNPLAKLGSVALPTFSDGNLTLTTNASVDTMAVATMGITSGTFYYEATLRSANTYHQFGVASKTDSITTSTDRVTYFGFNGYIYNNSTATSGYGANSAGDVLRVACDADAGTVKFYLNTTLLSTESWTSDTGLYIPFMAGSNGTGYIADVNFGQQPFKYDPPE